MVNENTQKCGPSLPYPDGVETLCQKFNKESWPRTNDNSNKLNAKPPLSTLTQQEHTELSQK